MKNEDNLEYALHNEKACKYIDKKPELTDWVITTAFYSALHFVRFKLFPLTFTKDDKEVTFEDFESYYTYNNPLKVNKHSLLSELIEEHIPEIAIDYNKLKDISWTARYHNYKFSRDVSNMAKERLQRIKSFCRSE